MGCRAPPTFRYLVMGIHKAGVIVFLYHSNRIRLTPFCPYHSNHIRIFLRRPCWACTLRLAAARIALASCHSTFRFYAFRSSCNLR